MYLFFGVSRSAYYEWLRKLEQVDRDRARMEQVQEAYEASHEIYGYRRIVLWLKQKKGMAINHKAVLRLMKKLGIQSRARRRKAYRKLEGLGTDHTYRNVLNRDFMASRPSQKSVTDITCIMTQQGWCYLATIKDLFNGFIVATHNSIGLVTQTVHQAKQMEKATDGLILHSDHIVPMSFGRITNSLHKRIMMSL